jgi:hypothetical protein
VGHHPPSHTSAGIPPLSDLITTPPATPGDLHRPCPPSIRGPFPADTRESWTWTWTSGRPPCVMGSSASRPTAPRNGPEWPPIRDKGRRPRSAACGSPGALRR